MRRTDSFSSSKIVIFTHGRFCFCNFTEFIIFWTKKIHGGKFQVTFYLQKNLHQRLIRMDHHHNLPQIHHNLFAKPRKQQKNLNQPIFHLDNFYSRLMSGKKVQFRKIDLVLTIFLAFTALFFII